VKLGRRHGDGAELAILELVDFNVGQDKSTPKVTKKTGKQKKGAKTKKSAIIETSPETTGKKSADNEVETGTDSPPISESSGNGTEKG
jgi:large subunit ribosomal protein L17